MEFNIPPLLRAGLFALFASRLPAARPRVAFLDDPLPGADPEIPVLIRQSPVSAGRTVRPLTVAGLAAPRFLTPGRDDILVLTRGDHLSASARENILGFLISGGDLILAGGGEGFLAERFQKRIVLPAFSRYEPYWLHDVETVAA